MHKPFDCLNLREGRLPTENLKCCPLCGVLNAVQNELCFVCGWHGRFDHDAETIEDCLIELLARCPELADALAEPPQTIWNLWGRIARSVRYVFRKRIDVRV